MKNYEIAKFKIPEENVEIDVLIQNKTAWLTRKDMALLFDVNYRTIITDVVFDIMIKKTVSEVTGNIIYSLFRQSDIILLLGDLYYIVIIFNNPIIYSICFKRIVCNIVIVCCGWAYVRIYDRFILPPCRVIQIHYLMTIDKLDCIRKIENVILNDTNVPV